MRLNLEGCWLSWSCHSHFATSGKASERRAKRQRETKSWWLTGILTPMILSRNSLSGSVSVWASQWDGAPAAHTVTDLITHPCYFPLAAVKDYHNLSGLKYYYLMVMKVRGQKWAKIKVSVRCIPFWRLQGRICFLVFSIFCWPPAFLGLWLRLPSSKPALQHLQVSLWLWPPSSTFKDLVIALLSFHIWQILAMAVCDQQQFPAFVLASLLPYVKW